MEKLINRLYASWRRKHKKEYETWLTIKLAGMTPDPLDFLISHEGHVIQYFGNDEALMVHGMEKAVKVRKQVFSICLN